MLRLLHKGSRGFPGATAVSSASGSLNSLRFHHRRLVSSSSSRSKSLLAEAVAAASSTSSSAPSTFQTTVTDAAKLVEPDTPVNDPFSIVSKEMSTLAKNIGSLLGSGHPTLNKVAMYYFQSEGKHVRPLIVLLLSKALSEIPLSERTRGTIDTDDVSAHRPMLGEGIDDPLSPLGILHGINPEIILNPLSRPQDPLPAESNGILPKQRRLAEIVEMIHTASLLHDDVIDNSATRRSQPSGNIAFGNKMAILAGDFLLGRASVAIARIRNAEVIELLSTTIANLVEGEFMQLKNTAVDTTMEANRASFEYYIHKTYLKTASLMSKSCRAAAVLSGANDQVVEAAYAYGRNLGLCFQIVDDMLDYTIPESDLGKPAGADLKLGLATAPVLYAWEQFPELGNMIRRKFDEPGDVELARKYVAEANGVEKTRLLAVQYADEALRQLSILPESDSLAALKNLTLAILNRKK
ncbi:trans-hexaprenyltranstransferase [Sugiyamaella lignohabitans]|uniref:Trans-hexaprenyltranstransferase n=1 Tax=Sugiyamaella lignohabitans TaxID=796027 RepID=A0A167CVK3_9ASCO|nr:trans-hexaprenyltranstransferase [Sugiyamaella lignohabitans]ANB12156.1 trans-hexaprenyltranstransferase [Sugiyamaella lignohabitans]